MVGGGGGAVSPLQQLVHYQVRPLAAHAGCPQRTPAHEEGAGQQRQQAAPAAQQAGGGTAAAAAAAAAAEGTKTTAGRQW